jgi:hypothetical protein
VFSGTETLNLDFNVAFRYGGLFLQALGRYLGWRSNRLQEDTTSTHILRQLKCVRTTRRSYEAYLSSLTPRLKPRG